MTVSTVKVPEEMSYINAIYALWYYPALVLSRKEHLPIPPLPNYLNTSKKVHEYFQKICPSGQKYPFVDYFNNTAIKVDFKSFPQLDPTEYDERYGTNACKNALFFYVFIDSSIRFDKDDEYLSY